MDKKSKAGKINITKELFCEIFEVIRKQMELDDKCGDAFNIILPNDFTSGYDNSLLSNQLLKLVKVAFNDNTRESWIDYFIWELNFGKSYSEGCACYKDGSNINLSSVNDLYEFLIKN